MRKRLLALIPFCFLVWIIGLHFDQAPAASIPAPSNEIEITKTDSANKGEATGEGNVKLKTGWDVKKDKAGDYMVTMFVYDKDDKFVKSISAD